MQRRRVRYPDLLGVKGAQAVGQVRSGSTGLNPVTAFETGRLEYGRGRQNSWCSGEMHRYQEEYRWRRRPAGPRLTLRLESVGSKQD